MLLVPTKHQFVFSLYNIYFIVVFQKFLFKICLGKKWLPNKENIACSSLFYVISLNIISQTFLF